MIRPDEIIRSNRKTLAISVDPFGRLIVRAPKRCGEERIFAFIREKEGWILRQKAKMQGAGIYLPPENLNGYELLLLGKKYKIILNPILGYYIVIESRIILCIKNLWKLPAMSVAPELSVCSSAGCRL